jgi:RimJ/RimL family protein N-acetyltransferase
MVALLAPDFASLAYIAFNMRQADRDEIYNIVGHNNPVILAQQALDASKVGSASVASRQGRPIAVCGFVPLRPGVSTAFAFATDAFPGVALALTRHALRVMKPALLHAGFHRLQCESRADHHDAHRWLETLGFRREGVLRQFGSDGSDYIQFSACSEPKSFGQRPD